MLDVTSINVIEGFLLGNVSNGFAALTVYAKHLLYYFICFEIIFSGLGWALYQHQYAERLFFQLIKIGLILFVVENYTDLLNTLLSSATIIGQQLGQSNTTNILLNPGAIWQYGYNFAVSLLQLAATADGFALPMIFMVMGFGILLVVGLFGIQIFIQVVAFYFVAAMSLLIIPLSVFSPLKDFFSQSLKSLLQAAARLMVQMLLVSAAVSVWSVMSLQKFTPEMNINVPLGFLFTGLLFVFASAYLTRLVENVVGSIQWQSLNSSAASSVTVSTTAMTSMAGASVGSIAQVAATQSALTATLATPSGTLHTSPATSPSPATAAAYMNAVKADFSAKSADAGMASSHNTKQLLEKERKHREDVLKIKEAFQEVLAELKEK